MLPFRAAHGPREIHRGKAMGMYRRIGIGTAVAAPVANRVDLVGNFQEADALPVADQHALHAQTELALDRIQAGDGFARGAEFAVGGDEQIGQLPALILELGDRLFQGPADSVPP